MLPDLLRSGVRLRIYILWVQKSRLKKQRGIRLNVFLRLNGFFFVLIFYLQYAASICVQLLDLSLATFFDYHDDMINWAASKNNRELHSKLLCQIFIVVLEIITIVCQRKSTITDSWFEAFEVLRT